MPRIGRRGVAEGCRLRSPVPGQVPVRHDKGPLKLLAGVVPGRVFSLGFDATGPSALPHIASMSAPPDVSQDPGGSEQAPSHPLLRRLLAARHWLAALFSVLLFLAALWVMHRETASVHMGAVLGYFGELSPLTLLLGVLLSAGSYLAMTGYDAIALDYLGKRLPYGRVALVSFVAVSVGQNVGLAWISANAVRLRMYTAAGLSATDVAVVAALCSLAFGIGVAVVGGMALVSDPARAALVLHLPVALPRLLGWLILAATALYLIWGCLRRQPLRVRNWLLRVPGPSTTLAQIGLAVLDLSCSGGVLFMFLPPDLGLSFPMFLGIYLLAIVAGIASHVPGGVGVFESILLLALPDIPREGLLGAVVAYRILFYVAPFGLAALLAAGHELHLHRRLVGKGVAAAGDLLARIAPQIMAVLTFVAGAVLLGSGVTRAVSWRIELLSDLLPLPLLEIAHLTASLVGLALLVLAHSLNQRVRAAYRVTLWLLLAGILSSLVKGLDYEESLLLAALAGVLWLARDAFERPASLLDEIFSAGWISSVTLALIGSLWLGLFSYKHMGYSNELWWRFAFHADAPRALRASLLVVLSATGLGLIKLLRSAPPVPGLPGEGDLARAAAVVARSPSGDGHLALLGDKRLLFSEAGDAFVMYQVKGRSWIAMGDPVGAPDAIGALAWRFLELSDYRGGRPVFYQVDGRHLPLYTDLGLAPLRIGEEALVPLAGFSLEGSERAELRQAYRQVTDLDARFEVIEARQLDAALADLQRISDAWLQTRRARERGFALGFFEPAYLRRCLCALVRIQGRIVAFASLWASADRAELAPELMRFDPAAPRGTMDYLLAEVMLWGAAKGYGRCNLGLAPLADLRSHPLAPTWQRLGTLIYRHGEHFSDFEAVRAYKSKLQPTWLPKYIAAPRGFAVPALLMDVAALISGELRVPVVR